MKHFSTIMYAIYTLTNSHTERKEAFQTGKEGS